MVEPFEGEGLVLEPPEVRGGRVAKDLDRHRLTRLQVVGPVHVRDAATSENGSQRVAATEKRSRSPARIRSTRGMVPNTVPRKGVIE